MITRAQAEALLTLAESLEACERNGLAIAIPGRSDVELQNGFSRYNIDISQFSELTAVSVRFAVNALVPKHTGS